MICMSITNFQKALIEMLIETYHELEKDISPREILRDTAIDAGLGRPEVEEWLKSNLGGNSMDAEALENRKMRNLGMPTFIIQGVYRVNGAQDPQDYLEIVKVKEDQLRA